jgi:hypothetical protein
MAYVVSPRRHVQEGKKLRLDMSVEAAYQRAMGTVHQWVQNEVDASKTLAVFRTYSPAHTRHAYVVIQS